MRARLDKTTVTSRDNRRDRLQDEAERLIPVDVYRVLITLGLRKSLFQKDQGLNMQRQR